MIVTFCGTSARLWPSPVSSSEGPLIEDDGKSLVTLSFASFEQVLPIGLSEVGLPDFRLPFVLLIAEQVPTPLSKVLLSQPCFQQCTSKLVFTTPESLGFSNVYSVSSLLLEGCLLLQDFDSLVFLISIDFGHAVRSIDTQ